jgi:hypothetical protein
VQTETETFEVSGQMELNEWNGMKSSDQCDAAEALQVAEFKHGVEFKLIKLESCWLGVAEFTPMLLRKGFEVSRFQVRFDGVKFVGSGC